MKQKSHKKHNAKNPPDLFPSSGSPRPLSAVWANAAQLLPYTALDEAALRRRERELNPATGAPWIPPARGSKWEILPTLAGCTAWRMHQLATADSRGLPRQCASMKDVEATFHLPREMQEYAREHFSPAPGEELIFEASNRVNVLPMLRRFKPFLKKVFSKTGAAIAELEGFEDLDLDTQRAKCYKQDEIQKRRDNALATAQLHTRDGIEKEIAEPLAAIFAHLKNYEKTTGGKLKSLLLGAGLPPELVQQTITTAAAGIREPLQKLREQLALSHHSETAGQDTAAPANQLPQ